MIRKARAVWQGTGKDGAGRLETDSGALSNARYTAKMRFETEPGTNPEELIAAAHASCFGMALAFQLQMAGFDPKELATECAVTIVKGDKGFDITKSALSLRADVPGIDRAKFEELARTAEKNCPVSKVLKAEITMDFTLAQAAA
jgi:lipoyl-dependent peroxiredoxin